MSAQRAIRSLQVSRSSSTVVDVLRSSRRSTTWTNNHESDQGSAGRRSSFLIEKGLCNERRSPFFLGNALNIRKLSEKIEKPEKKHIMLLQIRELYTSVLLVTIRVLIKGV